ncbi:MAG TPA: hypothetical protein VLJ76_08350 [Gaiellaceae bacterium]|nr:hypothetical protein [Gaiellaceae bacterium]
MKVLALVGVALIAAAAAAGANPKEPKKVIIPAVQAKAKAINVQLSDLPKSLGFKPKPAGPDTGTPVCSYYNPDQSDLTENGDSKSPDFTLANENGSFIASSTSIFKTAAQGRTAYARVVQPKLPACLAQIFKQGAGSGVTIVSAKTTAFTKLAERSNAYRISATFASGKQKIPVYLDVVVMNRAKVDTVIFFAGIGTFFNTGFEQTIASKVAARTKNQ